MGVPVILIGMLMIASRNCNRSSVRIIMCLQTENAGKVRLYGVFHMVPLHATGFPASSVSMSRDANVWWCVSH